jgi:hypothetical protein
LCSLPLCIFFNLQFILLEVMFVPTTWQRTLRQPFLADLDKSEGVTGEYNSMQKGRPSSLVRRLFIGRRKATLPAVCGSVWMPRQAYSSDVASAAKDVDEWLLWNIDSHPLYACFNPLKNVKGGKNIPFPTLHKHKVTISTNIKTKYIYMYIYRIFFVQQEI